MYRVAENMVDLVGYTPMVKINHIVPNGKVKVYAKLERYNPAGSVKDRIAKYMIEYGEREGLLIFLHFKKEEKNTSYGDQRDDDKE